MPLLKNRSLSNPTEESVGRISCEERLVAPFSGRKCAAYEIAVMFDVSGDARPPEWILAEYASSNLQVGQEKVFGSQVIVDVSLEKVSKETFEASGLDIKTFLRKRGLFLTEGDFQFYETVIEDGQNVIARFHEDQNVVSLRPFETF